MKAFSIIDYVTGENSYIYESKGMNLRDYFAAKALQGILACNYEVKEEPAVLAYKFADEMMKARETNE